MLGRTRNDREITLTAATPRRTGQPASSGTNGRGQAQREATVGQSVGHVLLRVGRCPADVFDACPSVVST